MVDSQTLQRLRSDPQEMRIRFLIQILGRIWGFFLKLGPTEILGLLDDVILFLCVCGKQRERKELTANRLVFRVRCGRCQPQKEQLASPGASICQQGKKSCGAPGSLSRALVRAQRAWGDPAGTKYTQLYTHMINT